MVEASWEARASLKEEYSKKGPDGPAVTIVYTAISSALRSAAERGHAT
jgi:hypothetical protein